MQDSLTDKPPADLDQFWERTLVRARSIPLDVKIEPVKDPMPFHTFRLTYRSLDGVPIRAYLSLPWDAISTKKKSKRWPVIVTCPGYSGWGQVTQLSECQLGYAVLQMYPRGMGESAELWRVPDHCVSAWINYGRENPEGFYYQGAYMDMVRAIDYLVTRPDIDPGRIGLSSGSGGGLIVLAVGSLDPRVRAVVAEEPFLCDFLHNPAQANSQEINDPVFLRTWSYFEPMNLVHRLRAPTLLIAGGKDTTCPPVTIRAIFDRLAGIKALHHDPDEAHTASSDFHAMNWAWMNRYLKPGGR